MKASYHFRKIERSRIATFDIFSVGLGKHHINAMLEFDVTGIRTKLRALRKQGMTVSFNGWLIRVIASVLEKHPEASAYIFNKKKLIIFDDINVSLLVEKQIDDSKVPIPVVIEKANKKTALEITHEIESARSQKLKSGDIVLKKRTSFYEKLYYFLPGVMRRSFWRLLSRKPALAYKLMGNVAITSVGMIGKINGWFIHKSVHPLSFGIGSVLNKPVIIKNEIKIREILNMTVLIDHDVIDGAPMVRFLDDLTNYIENGKEIT